MTIRDSHFRDTLDYVMNADGTEERRTYTYSRGDRWRRTFVERTGRKSHFRYHVKVCVWIRVPWLAWAMFA